MVQRIWSMGKSIIFMFKKIPVVKKCAIANSCNFGFGVCFLTGSIVFLVIADIIVKPLTRLTNAIKELSNGNYNVRVDNVGQELKFLN